METLRVGSKSQSFSPSVSVRNVKRDAVTKKISPGCLVALEMVLTGWQVLPENIASGCSMRPADVSGRLIDILKFLVYDGYLYRYGVGVYSIYDDVSDEEILNQKYLIRAGRHIGVYYGNSLLYRCGIMDDRPDKDYILSNACLKKEFDNKKIGDITMRVKRPYSEITDENYRIIEGLNLVYEKKISVIVKTVFPSFM